MSRLKVFGCFKIWVLAIVMGLLSGKVLARSSSEVDQQLQQAIQEAEDYSLVKPSQSIQILEAQQALLAEASDYVKFQYFKTGFWTSVYLYDSDRIAYFAQSMAATKDFADSKRYFHEVLNSLAVWYRVNQDYTSSQQAGRCAVGFSQTVRSVNRNSVSTGLTQFLLNNYSEAQQVFEINQSLSKQTENVIGLAAAKNNLGLLHIFTEKYDLAERYLKEALKLNEDMARAKGTALNLVNLLFVYYIQQDWDNYHRLNNRAKRSSTSLDNHDIKQYVFWLNRAFLIKTKGNKARYVEDLVNRYKQVKEPTVLKLIEKLAETLDIELPQPKVATKPLNIHFSKTFPMCSSVDKAELKVNEFIRAKVKEISSTYSGI